MDSRYNIGFIIVLLESMVGTQSGSINSPQGLARNTEYQLYPKLGESIPAT